MGVMGQRIRGKRVENCLTQLQLANMLVPPVKRQTIAKWENVVGITIKRDYIGQLSAIFHCDPMWLMGFTNEDHVTLTYEAPGKEPVTTVVNKSPIIGESSKRVKLYKVALKIPPESLDVAIELLESLI